METQLARHYWSLNPRFKDDLKSNNEILLQALTEDFDKSKYGTYFQMLRHFEGRTTNASIGIGQLLDMYSVNFEGLCTAVMSQWKNKPFLPQVKVGELLINLSILIELIILGIATEQYRSNPVSTPNTFNSEVDLNELNTTVLVEWFDHFNRAHHCREKLSEIVFSMGSEIRNPQQMGRDSTSEDDEGLYSKLLMMEYGLLILYWAPPESRTSVHGDYQIAMEEKRIPIDDRNRVTNLRGTVYLRRQWCINAMREKRNRT